MMLLLESSLADIPVVFDVLTYTYVRGRYKNFAVYRGTITTTATIVPRILKI